MKEEFLKSYSTFYQMHLNLRQIMDIFKLKFAKMARLINKLSLTMTNALKYWAMTFKSLVCI